MKRFNFSVGCDIEQVARFNQYVKNGVKDNFLKRIFTVSELNYCFKQPNPARHLAARYAAKEAVTKALSKILVSPINFKTIQVVNNKKGQPTIKLARWPARLQALEASLSHSGNYSLALVAAVINKR